MRMNDITVLDKNMAVMNRIDDPSIEWHSARTLPFALEGLHNAYAAGSYRRMDAQVAAAVSEGVSQLALCTAGGRVRFKTDSPYVAIHAEMKDICRMDHMAFCGIFGFDMYIKREGTWIYRGTFRPPVDLAGGYESELTLPGGMCEIMINFPLYNGVDELRIGLCRGSRLAEPCQYAKKGRVVYYGSSITQGGCASRPGNSYQSIIGRMLDCDYLNLGFSGNAKGERAIAEYIAGLENMAAFVCDYDHNAPTPEHLKATHKPLYEIVRAENATLPIIFITRPNIDERIQDSDVIEEDRARRAIVRATYDYARAQGDEYVSFIDGARLFDGFMRDSCTVDGCHPNDLGFMRMAEVIGSDLGKWLKI